MMGFLSRSIGQKPPEKEQRVTLTRQEPDTIMFEIKNCQSEELKHCRIGDYVNLWIPKDDSRAVSVFRRGSIGGDGRIGYVPNKFSRIIAKHLVEGLKCETEMIEINANKSKCKIKCRLITKEEMIEKQAADFKDSSINLRNEFQKKYTPKNSSLVIKIQLPQNHRLVEGQEIFLENKPIDYYVQNVMRLSVNFLDNNGTIVAQKSYEPKIIRTLLRAYFNKYPLKMCIKKIETPDKYTLKYVEFIEAIVEVSLSKDE